MLVSDICARAFRLAKIIDAADTADSFETTQAVEAFQAIINNLPENIVGGAWIPVVGVDGYTAGEDERIICASTMTIYKPTYVTFDGAAHIDAFDDTLARLPLDGARIEIVDTSAPSSELWFYRADIADWKRADNLTESSECPFNRKMDEAFQYVLAGQLKEEYGGEVGPTFNRRVRRADALIRGTYFRPPASALPDYF